jgi:hypothetical protein
MILKDLVDFLYAILIDSGRFPAKILPKNVDTQCRIGPQGPILQRSWTDSALASRAIVGAASGEFNAPDGGLAEAARLARALVDAMLELKEASRALGIHIIRDGRPAQTDGVRENLAQGETQLFQLRRGQPVGPPARPDARLEKALVRIDVANTREERLIQQRCLDGHASLAEELRKRALANGERLGARRFERGVSSAAQVAKFQPAEASRIYKPQLVAAGEI